MQIWLKNYENTEKLRLPVLPAEVTVQRDTNVTTVLLPALGEVAMIGKGKLFGLTLDSFFPSQHYPFCAYSDFPTPEECVAMIEKWRSSGKPIRVLVTGTGINMLMAVLSFQYTYGRTGDLDFSLILSEYKMLKYTKITPAGSGEDSSDRPGESSQPRKHKVVAGDTLYKIAKKFYGKGTKENVDKIVKANKIIKNPNVIQIGWELVIP